VVKIILQDLRVVQGLGVQLVAEEALLEGRILLL
jgi:hypothetical protein